MRTYSSLGNLQLASHLTTSSSSSSSPLALLRPIHSDNHLDHMPTANDIQSHLYTAFLSGRTADVSLCVSGTWEGVYRLHRVVLIQAGFFRSLFDGGFREGAFKSSQGEMSVIFDDPNITRAAFEICLARLYGGGPALFVDPRIIPSRREPLTLSFPRPLPRTDCPQGQHYATPRFLLSLLATAIYLSIPSVVSQTIQLVLKSLGPHTVIRYLNFAIGKGIGENTDEEAEAATDLEQLCQESHSLATIPGRSKSVRSPASRNADVAPNDDGSAQKTSCAPDQESLCDESDSDSIIEPGHAQDDFGSGGLVFMYGAASNKIGEAAACWLCRWGVDMLVYEEVAETLVSSPDVSSGGTGVKEGPFSSGRRRALTESHVSSAPIAAALSEDNVKENVPTIWRRGGMDAKWARVVLSSDSFFVKDERERYDVAKRVVELRRRVSVESDEEKEWDELFATGIHYMHMAFDDLIEISQDISPITLRPYVPPSIIQAAHWDQSVLRHRITCRYSTSSSSPTTPPRSPKTPHPPRDGLGLSVKTSEIKENLIGYLHGAGDKNKSYYPIPADSSSRIGDTTGIEGASMDQLFNPQTKPLDPTTKPSTSKGFTSYAPDTFFGILARPQDATACVAADPDGQSSWSPFPPIRFGVEFWGVENLQEKARLTSQTIWYAGSLFNVYIQVVRKKGFQLGMYLHRLSAIETIPTPSSPPLIMMPSTSNEERRWTTGSPVDIPASSSTPSLYRPASRGTANTSAPSRSATPAPSTDGAHASPSTTSGGSSSMRVVTSPQHAQRPPAQPYRDPREAVRAHFTLLCMSPTGGALTKFTSAPDAFVVGKSWGWKSSALQSEELVSGDVNAGESTGGSGAGSVKRECSLRATVVIGLV